jgi:hypothetical protein
MEQQNVQPLSLDISQLDQEQIEQLNAYIAIMLSDSINVNNQEIDEIDEVKEVDDEVYEIVEIDEVDDEIDEVKEVDDEAEYPLWQIIEKNDVTLLTRYLSNAKNVVETTNKKFIKDLTDVLVNSMVINNRYQLIKCILDNKIYIDINRNTINHIITNNNIKLFKLLTKNYNISDHIFNLVFLSDSNIECDMLEMCLHRIKKQLLRYCKNNNSDGRSGTFRKNLFSIVKKFVVMNKIEAINWIIDCFNSIRDNNEWSKTLYQFIISSAILNNNYELFLEHIENLNSRYNDVYLKLSELTSETFVTLDPRIIDYLFETNRLPTDIFQYLCSTNNFELLIKYLSSVQVKYEYVHKRFSHSVRILGNSIVISNITNKEKIISTVNTRRGGPRTFQPRLSRDVIYSHAYDSRKDDKKHTLESMIEDFYQKRYHRNTDDVAIRDFFVIVLNKILECDNQELAYSLCDYYRDIIEDLKYDTSLFIELDYPFEF